MQTPTSAQKVVVIGHRNPDTDSICSAIAYAALKNKTGLPCEARRAGPLNRETTYVLDRFGVTPPRMCTDVNPKVRNVEYREIDGISPETSIREAWFIMRDQNIDTLAVVTPEKDLLGLITMDVIAMANMDVFDTNLLGKSHTTFKNILTTMDGTLLTGSEETVLRESARVFTGAATPDILEETLQKGDVVLLSNRYEAQFCSIEMGAELIIVCGGSKVGKTVLKLAEENGVSVMTVPHDTYAAGRLISQSVPVRHFMQTDGYQKFTRVTPLEDAIKVMAKVRRRYFPILNSEGKYCGMLSSRNVMNLQKRPLILMDHNESTQAVEGYENSEILEIIDHHRIGSLQTAGPVYFRNQVVGSTCTIVAQIYEEQDEELSPTMASLLLSGILSDTLKLTSPTTTGTDRLMAKRLSAISGLEIETYAEEMFGAGEQIAGKTAEEVFNQDYKMFMCGDVRFGVAQGNYLTAANLNAAMALMESYLPDALARTNTEDLYIILTDIQKGGSYILRTGKNAEEILLSAFDTAPDERDLTYLPGVLSRKKQFLPKIMDAYQRL